MRRPTMLRVPDDLGEGDDVERLTRVSTMDDGFRFAGVVLERRRALLSLVESFLAKRAAPLSARPECVEAAMLGYVRFPNESHEKRIKHALEAAEAKLRGEP